MMEIVKQLNWTYISIIYEESNYGIKVSRTQEFSLEVQYYMDVS